MIANSDYCIQYLINSKGIILANLCINCSRVFSPSISASNRSRHISVCYLSKRKRTIKKEPKSDADQSLANLLDRGRTYLNYSKNARSRKAYQLKKMDRNTDYNINLEALMSKALSSDLLPPEVFYANGKLPTMCLILCSRRVESVVWAVTGIFGCDSLLECVENMAVLEILIAIHTNQLKSKWS